MKSRKSESNIKQPAFEYLQDGILIRYNFKETTREGIDGEPQRMWEYDELCVRKEIRVEELAQTNLPDKLVAEFEGWMKNEKLLAER